MMGWINFFDASKIILTGNPVRKDISQMTVDRKEALNFISDSLIGKTDSLNSWRIAGISNNK